MSNILSHKAKDRFYTINNAYTQLLFSTLLIAGSKLAKTPWQKQFLIWLAEHDQNHMGSGMVGFDVTNVYWIESEFDEQKQFVVDLAKNALNKKIWSQLPFTTNEPQLIALLQDWISLFSVVQKQDIVQGKQDFNWLCKPESSMLNDKCPQHNIYLNRLGDSVQLCCMICNNL